MLPVLLALAVSAPAQVRWAAPDGCPDAAEAQRLVDVELAHFSDEGRADIVVHGTVRLVDPGHVLDVVLELKEITIRRSVTMLDCAAAAETLALVVAIVIDPNREFVEEDEGAEEVPVEPDVPPPPPPSEPRTAEPAAVEAERVEAPVSVTETSPTVGAVPPPPRRERPRGAVGVSGGLGFGGLRRIGAQIGGELAIVWRLARLGLGVEHWIRRRFDADTPPGSGVRLSITEARLSGGAILPVRRIEFPVVVFVGIGAIRATGLDVDAAAGESVLWASAGASAGLMWFPLRWLGFGGRAELVVPLVRHQFGFGVSQVVTGTGRIAGNARVGLEFRFP